MTTDQKLAELDRTSTCAVVFAKENLPYECFVLRNGERYTFTGATKDEAIDKAYAELINPTPETFMGNQGDGL